MDVASQQEALHDWFSEVCRSLDEVELKTCITRQIDYSALVKELEPAQEASIPEVPEVVKYGLQGSWLANFFKKPEPIIVRSQDPEVAYQDKLQADLNSQKLKTEAVEAHLLELKMNQEALEK